MASEVSAPPINGNYAPHQGYGGIEQSNNSYAFNGTTAGSTSAAQASSSTTATSSAGQSEIPKDEVGWFFVEQYYTTLSRNPEKLYLFYAKRSQLVTGQETEKVQVCVGHRAINDKIKALDFQDCKVRVTNVDSQSSDQNIVIQVVGEISNKSQPHKKFVQTFVLAEQTNGYFVLNDIFRYLVEEEDDYEAEVSAQPEVETGVQAGEAANDEKRDIETYVDQVNTLANLHDPVATEPDADVISKELEEKLLKDQPAAESVSVNGEKEEPSKSVEASSQLPVPTEVTADPELAPEKPKDPEPTPVASPPKAAAPPAPTQAAVPKPAVPAAPKTWANLAAAAAKVATPIVPTPAAPSTAAPAARPTPPSGKAPTPAAPNATTPAPAAAATAAAVPAVASSQRSDAPSADSQDEWNTVGGSHARQQSRQTNTAQPETPQYRGYIKNVYEHVDGNELRAALEKFGEVAYFDIARQKNCAFVDFKTADGYNKATSTPIEIGDDKLFVEERRVRPGSTPFVPRPFPPGRGGRGGVTGGQAPGGPRGGFQGPRGGFNPRGRGNGAGQRGGRGAAQAS